MEGWVDLGYPAVHRPGFKLTIFRSQVRCPNHYTNESTCVMKYILDVLRVSGVSDAVVCRGLSVTTAGSFWTLCTSFRSTSYEPTTKASCSPAITAASRVHARKTFRVSIWVRLFNMFIFSLLVLVSECCCRRLMSAWYFATAPANGFAQHWITVHVIGTLISMKTYCLS